MRSFLFVIFFKFVLISSVYSQGISNTIEYGTAKVLESNVLKTVTVAAKPINEALEILEVAELTEKAVEESGVPFPDTRLEGIYSLQLDGSDVATIFNPVENAKRVFVIARIGGKALRDAVSYPIIANLRAGDPQRFYSKNSIRTFDLVTSFDVNLRRIKRNTGLGDHLYLFVNNFDVNYPEFSELSVNQIYSSVFWHRYYFNIHIKIGGINIPQQNVSWSRFISGNFEIILNLEEYKGYFDRIMEEEISIVAELREKYTFGEGSIATLVYNSDQPVYLDPPKLEAASKETSIEISRETDSKADSFKLFRYSANDPVPKEINIDCGNGYCTDNNVEAGIRYYYYAISSKGSYKSSKSNIVNGMPTTDYKFESIIYDPIITAYSLRTLDGKLFNISKNAPVNVPGSSVTLSIPELGLVYSSVPIDQSGEFSIPYSASTQTGIYEMKVEAFIGDKKIVRFFEQEVIEAEDRGRDLEINFLSLDTNILAQSEQISGTIGVENYGEFAETNGRLIIELISKEGEIKESDTLNFSLAEGTSRNFNFTLPIGNATTADDYQLKLEVTNSEGLDENIVGNVRYRDIYIYNEVFSSPTYNLEFFEFDTVGVSMNTNAGPLRLTEINSGGDVKFEYNSSSTGYIEVDTEMNNFWESNNKSVILIPVNSSSSTGNVEVYVGTPSNAFIQNNQSVFASSRGSTSTIRFYKPGNESVQAGDVSFIFDENEEKLSEWRSGRNDINDDEGNLDFRYRIPENEPLGSNSGWIRLDYGDNIFVKQVHFDVKPFHQLNVSRDANVIHENQLTDNQGNILDPVRGMPIKLTGYLDNDGEFFEDFYIYNEIKSVTDTTFRRGEEMQFELQPDSTIRYEFIWNTTDLPAGYYNAKIIALHDNIKNPLPGAGSISWDINLINPPPFELNLDTDKSSYRLGDRIKISATAKRLGQTLSDAKVTASVEHPDGKVEALAMKYNEQVDEYEAVLNVNLGGNYYIDVNAERKYYIPQSASIIAKAEVDLSAVASRDTLRLFESNIIEIQTSPVGGVQGLAMDVIGSNSVFELDGFRESDFWSNSSSQINSSGSAAIIGVTNLGNNSSTSYSETDLGYLIYKAKNTGDFIVDFSNTSLIDSKGEPILTNINDNPSFKSIEQRAYLSFSEGSQGLIAGNIDTLDIIATNSYLTYASNTDLKFDQSLIEVLDVIEGNALSEYESDSTLYVSRIDNKSGNVSIAVSRTNTEESIEIGSGVLSRVVYKPLADGEALFSFDKGELITPRSNESLPVTKTDKTVNIGALPESMMERLVFERLENTDSQSDVIRLGIIAKNISNINSFASDLIYDQSAVNLEAIEKGGYFQNDATLLFDDDVASGKVSIGISNLDQLNNDGGISDTLAIARFTAKKEGTKNFGLRNIGMFDNIGDKINYQQPDSLVFEYSGKISEVAGLPDLKFSPSTVTANESNEIVFSVTVDSINNVNSFAADILYDPSVLSFKKIKEGNFLNEDDEVQTSLVSYDDSENGNLTIGISRLGQSEGVTTELEKTIAILTFSVLTEDPTEVRFSKTGLLLPDGETGIPHKTNTLSVAGIPDTITVNLSLPVEGPIEESVFVPKNGAGYIYYEITGDDTPIYYDRDFMIGLLNTTNSSSVEAPARFLKDDLIQLEIPYEMLQADEVTQYQLEGTFTAGSTTYQLIDQEVSFTASSIPQIYKRTWTIFAEGSAGVSGCLGCAGAGVSAAAAKGSIKGTGGVGLDITTNENKDLFFTRRVDASIGFEAEVPSFNFVVDEIDLDVGSSAELITSTTAGQTFSFSNLDISEDQKRLAEAGFLLETLSLSGTALSPTVGIFLPAIKRTINNIVGEDVFFEPAVTSNFSGIGLEGSVGVGIGGELGPLKVKAAEAASGFVLNTEKYAFPESTNIAKHSDYSPQNFRYGSKEEPIFSAIEMRLATAYDLSSLSWELSLNDNNSSDEQNSLTGGSLFSYGSGSELSMRGNFDFFDNLQSLEFSLTDGQEINVISLDWSEFQTTSVRIPGFYAPKISENGSALTSLFDPGLDLLFGKSLAKDFEDTFNLLSKDLNNDYPLEVVSYGTRGRGFEYNFGASFDAGLGVGGGVSLGFGFLLFDEITYPRNYVEIYDGSKNYLLNSSSYDQQMVSTDLTELFVEMFSATVNIAQSALREFAERYDELVESGKEFIQDLSNRVGALVGKIRGNFSLDGTLISTIFSPNTDRVKQKAFNTPEVRSMYSNSNVFYELPRKSLDSDKKMLAEAGSELFIISDVMDLSFIPEGSSDTLKVLDQPIEIEMIIYEDDLTNNDFKLEDKESVKLYRYITEEVGWVRVDGELTDDTVSADITTLGSYALGIEINRSDDSVAPEIYDSGYLGAADNDGVDEIFARVRDNRYGIGVDFGNTFMIVNDDTVSYSYQPENQRIFFDLTDYSNLTGSSEEVKIVATDFNGNQSSVSFSFERVTTNTDDEYELPDQFKLHNNYPNPFNPQTVIPFELPKAAHVEINIYDVTGRYITTLIDERLSAGNHQVTWNTTVGQGRELSSGVYFYQVKSGNYNQVKKMMLIK